MIDRRQIEDLIVRIADEEIMPRFGKLQSHEIRKKKINDPVTIADEAAERAYIAGLSILDPHSMVIGEEGASANPRLLDRLGHVERLWLIDPIDGTANYAAGKEVFGSMVAHIIHGHAISGWIYFPVQRDMLSALRGEGGFYNGQLLPKFMPRKKPYRGVISGTPKDKKQRKVLDHRKEQFILVRSLRCAAAHYRLLALGEIDFLLSFDTYPWDHAPGIAMVTELGGFTDIHFGKSFRSESQDTRRNFVLSAASREIWDNVHEAIIVDGEK